MKTSRHNVFLILVLWGLLIMVSLITVNRDVKANINTQASLYRLPGNDFGIDCVPPPPDLVSWWPGDSDADDIVGPNHGTMQNGATFTSGLVGQAFSFDGVDDYIQFGDILDGLNGGFTLEAWISTTATVGNKPIIAKYWTMGSSWIIRTNENDPSKVDFTVCSPSCETPADAVQLVSTSNINDGEWHFIAATFDGTTQQLYVDGELEASGTNTNPAWTDNHHFCIGSFCDSNGNSYLPFSGLIDEVSIYSRALSQEEIESIYQAGSAGKCKTLGERAATLARSLIGDPYLWGGKGWDYTTRIYVESNQIGSGYTYCGYDPVTRRCTYPFGQGVDCSGLVLWAYNKAYEATKFLDRSNPIFYPNADGQYRFNSVGIPPGDEQPGDLMFFDWNNDLLIDHVAMYLGGDDVAEAKCTGCGIVLSSKSVLENSNGFAGYRRPYNPLVDFEVRAYSPVNLVIVDPSGFTITAETVILTDEEVLREIPGEFYYGEGDLDNDDDVDDIVFAPTLKTGNYFIRVIPEPDAVLTDTYSLEVEAAGTIITLAQDVPLSDIPEQGYGISSTGSTITQFTPVIIYLPLIVK